MDSKGSSPPGIKGLEREPVVDVKNAWNYNLTPEYAFVA
jgi:hypothetical protein